MKQDKLLTIREVAQELGVDEQAVFDLAEQGKIPAYKIGGVYLRFKADNVQEIKRKIAKSIKSRDKVGFAERIRDFLYFNDFYILSLLIIIAIVIIILRI